LEYIYIYIHLFPQFCPVHCIGKMREIISHCFFCFWPLLRPLGQKKPESLKSTKNRVIWAAHMTLFLVDFIGHFLKLFLISVTLYTTALYLLPAPIYEKFRNSDNKNVLFIAELGSADPGEWKQFFLWWTCFDELGRELYGSRANQFYWKWSGRFVMG